MYFSKNIFVLASQGFKRLCTFTVGFDEEEYNEAELAKQVADTFDFQFHQIKLKGEDVYQNLRRAAWLHDSPLIHQNDAQMLAISKYAKDHVTVLLSGEASDELMGGYVRYKPLQYLKYRKLISYGLSALEKVSANKRFKKLNRYYRIPDVDKIILQNSCSLYPDDFASLGFSLQTNYSFRNTMLEEAKMVYPNEPVRQAMYLDQHTFLCSLLDRNDRMTMGASIECRVPFLDYRLVEMIGAMPTSHLLKGKKGKYLLFNSVAKKLPESIRSFRKIGFAVPWEKYLLKEECFNTELREMPANPIFASAMFDGLDIHKILQAFAKGDTVSTTLLRQLLMIHMWYKEYYTKF